MMRASTLLAAIGLSLTLCAPVVIAQVAEPSPVGEVKSLGQERFQIGRIVVDKRARSFAVPGRVHVLGKPLEYLATSHKGMKAYESLLELDVTGTEFNMACILIGLERDPKLAPLAQFRQAGNLAGPRLALSVAWTDAGKRHRITAAEAVLNPEADVKPESVEWVYTGSPASEDAGRFTTDTTGTLIGFVHDVHTLVESANTIGVGAYGTVRGSAAVPPVGTAVELIVEAVPARK